MLNLVPPCTLGNSFSQELHFSLTTYNIYAYIMADIPTIVGNIEDSQRIVKIRKVNQSY